MWFHLKFAAVVSVAWVLLLVLRPVAAAADLVGVLSPPGALAMAGLHAGLAGLFWWGSYDPPRRLVAVYVGLVTFALRCAAAIYLVLYAMQGDATMIVVVEMVLSIGLLAALINGLPGALRPPC